MVCKGSLFLLFCLAFVPALLKKFKPSFILILLTVLSCQKELDNENFRDVQPPDPTHPFDLNLISEHDTLLLFKNTEFKYQLNSYGLTIWDGRFSLGDQEWVVNSQDGSFYVSPREYSPGFDTLRAYIYTNSGSGSLADMTGGEGYFIQKNWLVLIDNRPAIPITPSNSITKEGYLKISWPKCDQYNFHSYEITGSHGINNMVYDADSCFYIDSSYVGGEITFRINLRVIGDDGQHAWGNTLDINDPEPVMNFEDIGLDSVRISWNRSNYLCRYKLNRTDPYPDITLLYSSSDTSFTIPQPGFGDRAQYILYTQPYHVNSSNISYSLQDMKYHTLGNDFVDNWPRYGYNHINKTLYTNNYDNMEGYEISSMRELQSLPLYNLSYEGLYSCATNSARVAALTSENIYVFEDNSLSDPIIIRYECSAKSIDHFYLTDNDQVMIAQKSRLELISIASGKVLATLSIDDYPVYSKWACISTSKDGKYTGVVTFNGIKLYSISDTLFSQVYSDTQPYRSILFDINDPGKVMVTYKDNNKLEIRSVPDFELIESINLPANATVTRNIDPESGYLLLTDYSNLYILDLESSDIVLKIPSTDAIPQLYGNRLFSNSGHTLDITDYLPE